MTPAASSQTMPKNATAIRGFKSIAKKTFITKV